MVWGYFELYQVRETVSGQGTFLELRSRKLASPLSSSLVQMSRKMFLWSPLISPALGGQATNSRISSFEHSQALPRPRASVHWKHLEETA